MTRKNDDFFSYALVSLRTCFLTHLFSYALISLLQKCDGKEGWRRRITKKDDDFSPNALVSLHTCVPTYSFHYFKKMMARKDDEEGWQGRMMTSLPMYLSLYILDFSPLHLYISQKNIPLRYLSEIVHLSKYAVCHPQLSQYAGRKLTYQLDAINALPLCGSQPCYQYWLE